MDFVDWCELILVTCNELIRNSPQVRSMGVSEAGLAEALSAKLNIPNFRRDVEYHKSSYYRGMLNAIVNLIDIGFLEHNERSKSFWNISRLGKQHIEDRVAQWFVICQEAIDLEHSQFLSAVNRLSPQIEADHVWLKEINQQEIISVLDGWTSGQLWNVANELKQWKLVSGHFTIDGGFKLLATYKGFVWEKRRGFTLLAKQIDELVAEWETTSVDFKRELHLDTSDQKAEFIKDMLSLANTKASGKHWMIIGFDNTTHAYHSSPDQRINQNRIEQILAMYTVPVVEVRYEVVDYREGLVGMIEVLRDPRKLPYSVARSIGDRKRIEQGDVFVRHGSQVEKPTPLELQTLQEESQIPLS